MGEGGGRRGLAGRSRRRPSPSPPRGARAAGLLGRVRCARAACLAGCFDDLFAFLDDVETVALPWGGVASARRHAREREHESDEIGWCCAMWAGAVRRAKRRGGRAMIRYTQKSVSSGRFCLALPRLLYHVSARPVSCGSYLDTHYKELVDRHEIISGTSEFMSGASEFTRADFRRSVTIHILQNS